MLLVWKLDRLGRDLRHLVNTVHELATRGIGFKVLTGQGAQIDTTTAQGKLVFGIFAALAEFERELISERTKAGLASARARGRHGGAPFKMTAAKLRLAMTAMANRDTKVGSYATSSVSPARRFIGMSGRRASSGPTARSSLSERAGGHDLAPPRKARARKRTSSNSIGWTCSPPCSTSGPLFARGAASVDRGGWSSTPSVRWTKPIRPSIGRLPKSSAAATTDRGLTERVFGGRVPMLGAISRASPTVFNRRRPLSTCGSRRGRLPGSGLGILTDTRPPAPKPTEVGRHRATALAPTTGARGLVLGGYRDGKATDRPSGKPHDGRCASRSSMARTAESCGACRERKSSLAWPHQSQHAFGAVLALV